MFTMSKESAERLRECVRRFDEYTATRREAINERDMDTWHEMRAKQLDLAYSLVGMVDGILQANNV